MVLMVGLVRQSRSSWFVDDPHHFQPGDFAGFAGRLALGVGKISRDRDHGFPHRFAQMRLSDRFQPAQDDRRDFLRRISGVTHFDPVGAAHLPLDRLDGAFRVQHILVLGRFTDQNRTVIRQPDKGRQNRATGVMSMTVTRPFSTTATSELVVPRSIPMIFQSWVAVTRFGG